MTEKYLIYLQSEEWRARRMKRLALSGNCCEVCSAFTSLRVHHLTYARIYNEPMEDLMALCERCHTSVEAAIVSKLLPRVGNVTSLRAATIAIISGHRIATQAPFEKPPERQKKKGKDRPFVRNETQHMMMGTAEFVTAMQTMQRRAFDSYLQRIGWNEPSMHSNAFALYDRWGRENGRSIAESRR